MCLATAKLFVSLFHIFFLFLFCILFTTKYHFSRCLFIFFSLSIRAGNLGRNPFADIHWILCLFVDFINIFMLFLLLLFLWIQNWNFFALIFFTLRSRSKTKYSPAAVNRTLIVEGCETSIHALLLARTCILSAVGVVFGIYVSLEVVGAMVSNFEFCDVYLLSWLCVLADSVLGFVWERAVTVFLSFAVGNRVQTDWLDK